MNGVNESTTGTTTFSKSEVSDSSMRLHQFIELTKPRLTILSVLTTLAGYYLGSRGQIDLGPLLLVLLGTFMVGGGCATFNMVIERELDQKMRRTNARPLPSGKISVTEAAILGVVLTVGGLSLLYFASNGLATLVAGVTFVTYVFIYTPLKRLSTLNTIVGAVPGALPPVIGWAAATGNLEIGTIAVFALVFFWQMPHFLALAWMYRKDYARAGFKMLPNVDPLGNATARQTMTYTAALLPVSLIPTLVGMSGPVYFFGAGILGVTFLILAARFMMTRKSSAARSLFHFSLLYLPILLVIMIVDGPNF